MLHPILEKDSFSRGVLESLKFLPSPESDEAEVPQRGMRCLEPEKTLLRANALMQGVCATRLPARG